MTDEIVHDDLGREVDVITYSTSEVALMAGVSYRQLDYWLRTGTIGFCDGIETPGSGMRRRWTTTEVDLVCEVVKTWRAAQEVVDAFRSGALWREAAMSGCEVCDDGG